MKQEFIIAVSIVVAVTVFLGIKVWLYKLLKFKVDESTILNFFKESGGNNKFQSTEAISTGTHLDIARISQVCIKSKAIERNANEKELWCLKQP